jgi:hypothetical protein
MKILPLLLFLSLFSVGPSLVCGAVSVVPELSIDAGLRNDQLDWTIAGTSAGTDPNILSELTWDDLQIYQFRLHGEMDLVIEHTSWFRPSFRGQLSYGRIYSGWNQDSDYDGDNRTMEYSRSNNAADQGNVLDLSQGAGLRFSFLARSLELVPLVGYSLHLQQLTLLDGYQTIPADGPFAGLDSSYDTNWWGPWLGLELNWTANEHLSFSWLTEYHLVEYFAEANWNLRAEFAHPRSFEHHADGSGWLHEIGLKFQLPDQWSFNLSGTLQRWQTDSGYDLVFLADGSRQTTRLNRVNWDSVSIQAGLAYAF